MLYTSLPLSSFTVGRSPLTITSGRSRYSESIVKLSVALFVSCAYESAQANKKSINMLHFGFIGVYVGG